MEINKTYKEGDILFCTVNSIENAAVTVSIEGFGKGNIVMSEVAAGRIRNIRDYVYPNKKIVCKVLKVYPDHLELSLRRVTGKEREETLEKDKKEKAFIGLLKGTLKEPQSVIAKIQEKNDLADFFEELKANPSLIAPYLKKEEAEKFEKLLREKKYSEKTVKKIMILRSTASNGVEEIKSLLSIKEIKDAEIKYLGSGQYSIITKGKDFKDANNKLNLSLTAIENTAKAKKIFFQIQEDK